MATINSFLLLEAGTGSHLWLEDGSRLILWSTTVADQSQLTLGTRAATLTFEARVVTLTLATRGALTVADRTVAITMQTRTRALTLPTRPALTIPARSVALTVEE